MPQTVTKATRSASPILLVLAVLCFLLPFVGVSCNSAGLQGLAGSLPGGTSGSGQSACLSAISNTDLYSYSGVNLATGSAPSTANIPSSCSSTTGGKTSSNDSPTIGVQPLLIVALVLIVVGILATVLRSPMRYAVALAASLIAAIVVIANNSVVHNTVSDKITALVNTSGGSSDINLQGLGGVGSFFNIHAAIGFTLILIALFLAVAVNALGWAVGSGLRIAPAGSGAAPPPEPPPPPYASG
ncbi:MAG: hypothetical protein M3Z57_05915 [Candidatus Dormibacteraeota bacterium]|nr:hypothetical protein [Candidatus Dormibacteraeota bacterium]